jgi:hypothetical protein
VKWLDELSTQNLLLMDAKSPRNELHHPSCSGDLDGMKVLSAERYALVCFNFSGFDLT